MNLHVGSSATVQRPGPMRSRGTARFLKFAAAGATGLVVNQLALWVATQGLGLYYLISAVLATQLSTLWNFAIVEGFVFKGAPEGRLKRFGWFWLMNNAWLVVRTPLLYLMTDVTGVNYLWSNAIVLGSLTLVRFGISDRLIWSKTSEDGVKVESGLDRRHAYDIHGVVAVTSDAPLPELASFRVAELQRPPDIEVTISNAGFGGLRTRTTVDVDEHRIRYVEHLGGLGFAASIELGSPVRLQASELLRHSPHVLYTNLIEPLLRWEFVRKGNILAHAACLQIDGHGVLITARTDTGKTTTCLKSIKEHGSGFVSDDMIIIDGEGNALSFPKPLTISAHTLQAVDGAPLAWKQRAWLQVQSRLHSKSGRGVGIALSRVNLPVATMNAIVQLIVPPPKFRVEELVPGVELVSSLHLDRLVVIERGDAMLQPLDTESAFEILSENTEDAYGFPPYPHISHALANGERETERDIRRSLVGGLDASLLRTPDRNWFELLPTLAASGGRASLKDQLIVVVPESEDDRALDLSLAGGVVAASLVEDA